MLKSKIFITGLLILTVVFCLHLNGRSIAGDCDDLEHSKGTPIITGDHSYPAGWLCTADPDIEYDTENSSETVDRNDSATILVIGNNAPFTWTISGTGFWFDSGYTQTTINTTGNVAVVYADNTACGSATITVTGCDGTVATGYVRCTAGQWYTISETCGMTGQGVFIGWDQNYYFKIYEYIQGKNRQEQWIGMLFKMGWEDTCNNFDCSPYCDTETCIIEFTCPEMGPQYYPCNSCCCSLGYTPACCNWTENADCYGTGKLLYQEWICP